MSGTTWERGGFKAMMSDIEDGNVATVITKDLFNDWYARDYSKKIRAVFRAKGQSGKHLCPPMYGYKKSDTDKNLWVVDEPAAEVVRKISNSALTAMVRYKLPVS